MSKITKTLFGGSDSRQSSTPTYDVTNTGFSRFNRGSGTLTLDPSIRALQEQTLAGFGNLQGQGQDILSGLRSSMNPFVQARVNPLQAELTSRMGQLQRSLGQRQLGGSSFGEQALTGFNLDAQRALGDARSLATQEALGAQIGALSGLAGLYGMPAEIAQQRLQQEMQALGFGKSQAQESTSSQTGGIIPGLFGKGLLGSIPYSTKGGGWGR